MICKITLIYFSFRNGILLYRLLNIFFKSLSQSTQDKNPKPNWKQSVPWKVKNFFSFIRIMQNENFFIGLLFSLFLSFIQFKVFLTIDNGDIIHVSEMQKYLINTNFNWLLRWHGYPWQLMKLLDQYFQPSSNYYSFQMKIFSMFWKHSYHIVGQQVDENAKNNYWKYSSDGATVTNANNVI